MSGGFSVSKTSYFQPSGIISLNTMSNPKKINDTIWLFNIAMENPL
jgi:hypothetical protein